MFSTLGPKKPIALLLEEKGLQVRGFIASEYVSHMYVLSDSSLLDGEGTTRLFFRDFFYRSRNSRDSFFFFFDTGL